MAEAALVFQPVDMAFSGTDIAGGQSSLESLSATLQLTGAVKSDVSWFHRHHSKSFLMPVKNVASPFPWRRNFRHDGSHDATAQAGAQAIGFLLARE